MGHYPPLKHYWQWRIQYKKQSYSSFNYFLHFFLVRSQILEEEDEKRELLLFLLFLSFFQNWESESECSLPFSWTRSFVFRLCPVFLISCFKEIVRSTAPRRKCRREAKRKEKGGMDGMLPWCVSRNIEEDADKDRGFSQIYDLLLTSLLPWELKKKKKRFHVSFSTREDLTCLWR